MAEEFAIVDYESLDSERFPESGVEHWLLTEPLGATDLRVNVIRLAPGEAVGPHYHEQQEEVFVPLTDGRIAIADETYEVSVGEVVRVGPEPVRSLRNETTDETQLWVVFGAPPVGTIEDYGEYRLPDEPDA